MRAEQVETLLKTQDPLPPTTSASPAKAMGVAVPSASTNMPVAKPLLAPPSAADRDAEARWQQQQQQHFNNASGESPQAAAALDDFNFNANMGIPINSVGGNFTWEMIGLGLEEPLPPQATIDELHQVYFEKVHPSIPMVHRYRYLTAMNL